MGLSDFITLDTAGIMAEFEAFALQQLPAAAAMDVAALRDHARQVLDAIALDMRQPQTKQEQREKSLGHAPKAEGEESGAAGEIHGTLRAAAGFDVNQTVAEYRALRASVIRLWMQSGPQLGRDEVFELVRFNEAMDEALAASILHFANEASRMRNLFLGVLSHELRTPLSTIMTSGHSLVLAARLKKDMPEAADRVLRGGRRIQSLLDDLLDYVRSGLGEGMRVSPTNVDMGQVCSRVVNELRAIDPARTIELDTLGDLDSVCDEQRVAQAFSNLVGNALKYGAASAPVKACIDGSSPDEISVSVRNSGPPIPKATRESLFEPLVRGVNTELQGYNLGLGLYIVRAIALAHGGSACVESDAATGTVFTIRLPRDAGAAAASAFPGLRMA
jgi:signal transduction histidine kinase